MPSRYRFAHQKNAGSLIPARKSKAERQQESDHAQTLPPGCRWERSATEHTCAACNQPTRERFWLAEPTEIPRCRPCVIATPDGKRWDAARKRGLKKSGKVS